MTAAISSAWPSQLSSIKGRFLLSLNNTPAVREVFGRFEIEAVTTTYTVRASASAQKVGEVLISGPNSV